MKMRFGKPLAPCVATLCVVFVAAQGCASQSEYDQLKARYDDLSKRNAEMQAQLADAQTARLAAASQPAPVSPEIAAAQAAAETGSSGTTTTDASRETSYTIKNGDTLWSLATRFYGSGKKWTIIRDANPGVVDQTKGTVKVGAIIVIPAAPAQ